MTDATPKGPLSGIRVLDFTEHMAGPHCTMILADMGAEVIKIERPGRGDSSRGMGDGSERNAYFRYINRNKKGVTLNYKDPEGKALLIDLIKTADVLVENYRPTVMPRAGLGYDGPYAARGGFDLIAQGVGGVMHVTGEPDGPPTSVGLPICDLGTGMWGAQGVLAALYEREKTGQGQLIECSLLETAVGYSSWTSAGWLVDQKEPTRQGSRHRQNAPYQRFETADGYIMIGAAGQEIWERCAKALGHPEWCEDPRFAGRGDRIKNRAELEGELSKILQEKSSAHWVDVLEQAGVPCGPVNTYADLFNDPQVQHRKMVVTAQDAELGDVPHIRTPIRMGDKISVRTVAPRLGEHNAEIFGSLGRDGEKLAELQTKKVI